MFLYAGCLLADVDPSDRGAYVDRLRDHLAVLRTLAGIVWLRGRPDLLAQPENILDALPADDRNVNPPVRFDAEKRALILPLLKPRESEVERVIPLPGSRVAAP